MRLLALLFPTLLLASPAVGDCLTTRLICTGYVNNTINTTSPSPSSDCSQGALHSLVSFDIPTGYANAEASADPRSVVTETCVSQADDEYLVTGVPTGTAFQLTALANLQLDNSLIAGRSPTYSYGELWVPPVAGAPSPNYDYYEFSASAPGEETETHQLKFILPVVAGTPFELLFEVGTYLSGGEGGYSRGRLTFDGLPPGASITSCKGFRQDQPVPAIAVSWGKLKVVYR